MSSRTMHAPESVPCTRAATVVLDGDGPRIEDVVRLADGAARPVPEAARQTLRACRAYRPVVGCELVTAVRAPRRRDLRTDSGLPAGRVFALAGPALDAAPADRPLISDVTRAAAPLDRFTDVRRGSAS